MNSQQTLSHPAGGSRLLAAVLQQALADLQGQDKSLQADASQFFTSRWYQHICQTNGFTTFFTHKMHMIIMMMTIGTLVFT